MATENEDYKFTTDVLKKMYMHYQFRARIPRNTCGKHMSGSVSGSQQLITEYFYHFYGFNITKNPEFLKST